MLGEREAVVVEATPFDIHGVAHVDVTLVYPDRVLESARLGRESTPVDLRPGEVVVVTKAMNTIVSIRRA